MCCAMAVLGANKTPGVLSECALICLSVLGIKLILFPADESHKEKHKLVPIVARGKKNIIKKDIQSDLSSKKFAKVFTLKSSELSHTHLQRTRKRCRLTSHNSA